MIIMAIEPFSLLVLFAVTIFLGYIGSIYLTKQAYRI